MVREPDFAAWVEDRNGRVLQAVAGTPSHVRLVAAGMSRTASIIPVPKAAESPAREHQPREREPEMTAPANADGVDIDAIVRDTWARLSEKTDSPDAEFRREYQTQAAYLSARGVSEEQYVRSRRIDAGLETLAVGAAAAKS